MTWGIWMGVDEVYNNLQGSKGRQVAYSNCCKHCAPPSRSYVIFPLEYNRQIWKNHRIEKRLKIQKTHHKVKIFQSHLIVRNNKIKKLPILFLQSCQESFPYLQSIERGWQQGGWGGPKSRMKYIQVGKLFPRGWSWLKLQHWGIKYIREWYPELSTDGAFLIRFQSYQTTLRKIAQKIIKKVIKDNSLA